MRLAMASYIFLSWLVSFMYHFLGTTTFLTFLFSASSLRGSTCYFSNMKAYKLKPINLRLQFPVVVNVTLGVTLRQPHTAYKWKQQKTCFDFNPISARRCLTFIFYLRWPQHFCFFFLLTASKVCKRPFKPYVFWKHRAY